MSWLSNRTHVQARDSQGAMLDLSGERIILVYYPDDQEVFVQFVLID